MRYFLGFLGIVALVVLVFVLVVRGFSDHSSTKNQINLTDYTNTATQVELIAEGPVTADQSYQELHITVGQYSTNVEILQGYNGQVVKTETYPNNANAYGTFLRALQLLNYTSGNSNANMADERGYCPTGQRYVYEIVNGPDITQRYWSGSCGVGTFKGNATSINTLFIDQVPDFSDFIAGSNVDFGL